MFQYSITCLETLFVIKTYFGVNFERMKRVLLVLRKETLISDLNKYMSCTYDPVWINGEHTDLKPAEVRVDELSDTTLELDELRDITLEVSELSDTRDGAGLAAERNGPFSAQRKVHKKFNMGLFLSKFVQPFP
ncbi:hypothetical protein IGI04_006208 [Brassica rapa subsp. trilocularis]|uniref:Uncharacterized protein n=1 Tax=Brassica rapa subsp. trilocularis TaxID=1813537 RepID=A0ABQ7NJF6_BRACM|nr:hypothetical protein IGI04_006208 [Brassica rapa subsp. trilocularis]